MRLQSLRFVHGVERRAGGEVAGRKRFELRRDFSLERCGHDDRDDWVGRAAGFDEASFVWSTRAETDFPAVGENERPGLWCAVHVGTGSVNLRHNRVYGPAC